MQQIKVIIGASYGDEGKGLATDFFCVQEARKHNTGSGRLLLPGAACAAADVINVLTNGGPQRGHTVELEDGRRHVFKHFGAASFRGAAIYFDRQFMINPMEFIREADELCAMNTFPEAYVNPYCRFTTPWDMLINQMLQEKRGNRSSCGFGIWETVLRYQRGWGIPFAAFAAMNRQDRIAWLRRVRDGYFAARIREIAQAENSGMIRCAETIENAGFKGILKGEDTQNAAPCHENTGMEGKTSPASGDWMTKKSAAAEECKASGLAAGLQDFFFTEELLFHFEEDCESMRLLCPMRDEGFLRHFRTVLFENAQGLLLDGNAAGAEAFTTPSTTGIGRVFRTVEKVFKGADVEVCYVTRSYLTRHGDGNLENEIPDRQLGALLPGICGDQTNVDNCFQGKLRYGMMDTTLLTQRILADFSKCGRAAANRFRPSVMITHLNEHARIDTDSLADQFGRLYFSDGRTAGDVTAFRSEAAVRDAAIIA